MNMHKIKAWVEYHWYRLKNTGSPPPLLISLPIIFVILSMEGVLKLANAILYYGNLKFIFDKLEKKLLPNITVSGRLLLTLKAFCILLILLMVMRFTIR